MSNITDPSKRASISYQLAAKSLATRDISNLLTKYVKPYLVPTQSFMKMENSNCPLISKIFPLNKKTMQLRNFYYYLLCLLVIPTLEFYLNDQSETSQNCNVRIKVYKKSINIVNKLVEKLLKCRILCKDILIFLGLDYRDASLITLYLVAIGFSIPKI